MLCLLRVLVFQQLPHELVGLVHIHLLHAELISLIGAYDIDTSIFFMLSDRYSQIPVLTIGTREESIS